MTAVAADSRVRNNFFTAPLSGSRLRILSASSIRAFNFAIR